MRANRPQVSNSLSYGSAIAKVHTIKSDREHATSAIVNHDKKRRTKITSNVGISSTL